MTLLLTEHHLRQLLTMRELVPLMERTLAAFSTGGAVQPLRPVIRVPEHNGLLAVMPAYLRPSEALGLKAVAFYPSNAARGLPTHLATILLIDAGTGHLLAILDGRLITEMRTAAVSAAATKYLASTRTPVLALLGAGVQARSHVEALMEAGRPERVTVWSRTRASAERLAGEVAERFGLPVAVSGSAEEAVRGAQVICTVTSSATPVLKGLWIGPGVHINSVGAAQPDWRELDTGVVTKARIFVDSRAATLAEAGDIINPMREGAITEAHIVAEIGEVFAGLHPGRTDPESVTLFKSVGLAVEDVAAAELMYRLARERHAGQEINLEINL